MCECVNCYVVISVYVYEGHVCFALFCCFFYAPVVPISFPVLLYVALVRPTSLFLAFLSSVVIFIFVHSPIPMVKASQLNTKSQLVQITGGKGGRVGNTATAVAGNKGARQRNEDKQPRKTNRVFAATQGPVLEVPLSLDNFRHCCHPYGHYYQLHTRSGGYS